LETKIIWFKNIVLLPVFEAIVLLVSTPKNKPMLNHFLTKMFSHICGNAAKNQHRQHPGMWITWQKM